MSHAKDEDQGHGGISSTATKMFIFAILAHLVKAKVTMPPCQAAGSYYGHMQSAQH